MGKHHLFVRLGTCTCTRLLAAVLRPHRAPRTSIIDSSPASRNREEGGRDLGAAHALLGVAIDLDLFGTELETRLAILHHTSHERYSNHTPCNSFDAPSNQLQT